jgi:periplasmic protein CpxP/Spy
MKRQILAIVAGAALLIAPGLSQIAVAQTAAPSGTAAQPHQRGDGKMAQLNLTETQKAQLKTIKEQSRTKMELVLTQTQKDQLKAAKASGQRGGWKSLNLTADQKAQIKKIRQDAKLQKDGVLTDAQKATLKQYRANHSKGSKAAGSNWSSTDPVGK